MSYSLRYNDEHLAGPSSNISTPLSFEPPNPPYKIGLPGHPDPLLHIQPSEYSTAHILQKRSRGCIDADIAGQCVIRPHFVFPGYNDEAMNEIHQFHDHFRKETYDDHRSSSTILGDSPGRSSAEDLDAYLAGGPHLSPRMQHNGTHGILRHHTAVRLPLYRGATSSFFSHHSVTPEKLAEFPSPLRVVTPEFEETDNALSDQVRPQSLSPFAPMPLQPIFHLEPQFRTIHDTKEPMPHILPPSDLEGTKSPPIDPLLISHHEGTPRGIDIPFARGSIAPRSLWPPSPLASKSSASNHHNFRRPIPSDIPLEIAKRSALELRASNPYAQLSQQFLLSFMGQCAGNLPWSCYIRGCGKQLTRKSHMVDHIRMHLDERVYACEYCPQTFLRKADCKRHSVAHNPEKAFQCDFCNKSFGRKDLLTRHRRKCESYFSETGGYTVSTKSSRKRKGVQGNSILDTQGTQNAVYVAGSLFSIPQEHFKRNNRGCVQELGNEGNKENIPPSPEDRRRKKARVF